MSSDLQICIGIGIMALGIGGIMLKWKNLTDLHEDKEFRVFEAYGAAQIIALGFLLCIGLFYMFLEPMLYDFVGMVFVNVLSYVSIIIWVISSWLIYDDELIEEED